MKALSVRQPWAWLICAGHKDVENRVWRTDYREPLLIHASRTYDKMGELWVRKTFPHISIPSLDLGCIIGRVNLTSCVKSFSSPWAEEGLWHWVLTDPVLFKHPIPCRGHLGLWTPPDDILAVVEKSINPTR